TPSLHRSSVRRTRISAYKLTSVTSSAGPETPPAARCLSTSASLASTRSALERHRPRDLQSNRKMRNEATMRSVKPLQLTACHGVLGAVLVFLAACSASDGGPGGGGMSNNGGSDGNANGGNGGNANAGSANGGSGAGGSSSGAGDIGDP